MGHEQKEIAEIAHGGMARQKLRREDEQLVEGLESLADGVEHGQRHVHCTEPKKIKMATSPAVERAIRRLLILRRIADPSLLTYAAQKSLHQTLHQQHSDKQQHRHGRCIAHFVAHITIVVDVLHDGPGSPICGCSTSEGLSWSAQQKSW